MQLSPARALALLDCLTVASIASAAPSGGSITISCAFGTLSAAAFQGDEAMSSPTLTSHSTRSSAAS